MALSACLIVTGCATVTTDELTVAESEEMSEKTVVMSRYKELPDFVAQTATNAQFGFLGLAAAKSNGNAMIQNNNIADPAVAISLQLAEGLEKSYSLKVIENGELKSESAKLENLVEVYQGYDYILDVRTLGWRSIHFPTDWNSYKVFYAAHARLIDAATQNVVAEELCNYIPEYEDSNDAPSYEELENGEGLRSELAKSVSYCVDYITTMAKLHKQEKEQDLAAAKE
ncbi:hypothetical protein [Alcanivorax sp.]|uniref:hypothetical protein n=1 Tax=Alcanivorax sp. TaxID=1872427 RepID=UPI0025BA6BC6|nr:hypothetical protein [Alcanivorax sp.]